MFKGNDYIVLTETQGLTNAVFYEEEDDIGVFRGIELSYSSNQQDIYVIPRVVWIMTENKLESYKLIATKAFNIEECTIDYDVDCEFELNADGKSMYNLYNIILQKNKGGDIKVDIDEFIRQYT